MKKCKAITINFVLLKYVVKYTPFYFWLSIFRSVLNGVMMAADVLFIKIVFDEIERLYTNQITDITNLFIVIIIMAGLYILHSLFANFMSSYYYTKSQLKLHHRMQSVLYEKSLSIDLENYDNPKFYNDFIWAMQESDTRAMSIASSFFTFLERFVSIGSITAIIITIDPFLLILIFIALIITVILQTIITKLSFRNNDEQKPIRREMSYINRIFYLNDFSKEIRLSSVNEVFIDKYHESTNKVKNIILKYTKITVPLACLQVLISASILDGAVMLILLYKILVLKTVGLGGFSASLNAVWSIFWQIKNIIYVYVELKEHSLYAEKFLTFLEYKPKIVDNEKSEEFEEPFKELSVKNLSFKYEGEGTENILNNINFSVKKGEKIAFVGYNGAGKSSLIKLILRLYEPNNGEIRINAKNINSVKLNSYRQRFGTVFQDFKIFSASIAENVLTDIYSAKDENIVTESLCKVILMDKVNKLKNGIQTTLTREFDDEGTILSGGEMQKIAIARIFAHNEDIVILDEPSSALDPISEYELNKTMMAVAYDKTVIFISHRLSTTRMADKIYMMANGEIIEEGSHEELIKKNGLYAEMFNLQSEKYRQT